MINGTSSKINFQFYDTVRRVVLLLDHFSNGKEKETNLLLISSHSQVEQTEFDPKLSCKPLGSMDFSGWN